MLQRDKIELQLKLFIDGDVIDALRNNASEIELYTIEVFENKTFPKDTLFSCV